MNDASMNDASMNDAISILRSDESEWSQLIADVLESDYQSSIARPLGRLIQKAENRRPRPHEIASGTMVTTATTEPGNLFAAKKLLAGGCQNTKRYHIESLCAYCAQLEADSRDSDVFGVADAVTNLVGCAAKMLTARYMDLGNESE